MPVILLGALGGMATRGILGMFVGATLLALGYQIFMGWVANQSAGKALRHRAIPLRRIDATAPADWTLADRRLFPITEHSVQRIFPR